MIEKMQELSRKLKKAYPNGYVTIQAEVWQHRSSRQEKVWLLSVSEIGINKDYPTWGALEQEALYLIGKASYDETKLKEGTVMYSDLMGHDDVG